MKDVAKYKYEYRCPECGTQLELKMRVTQTRRKCPHCGTPITPQEIDLQAAERARQEAEQERLQLIGCLGCFGIIIAFAVCGAVLRALGII